jgi:YVTN family beta-propeller protein
MSSPTRSTVLVSIFVIAACKESNPTPADTAPPVPTTAASSPSAPSSAEAPAASPSAWSFDTDKPDAPPAGFSFGRTGSGKEGRWVVVAAGDAPSKPNVLAQLDADSNDYRFPVAVVDASSFKDVKLSVSCKPISGKVDQGCGLVWRYKDANNYYLTRANALEDNVRLYHVKDGQRRQFASWNGKVASGVWHKLAVEAKGDRFVVFFDDKKVMEEKDTTFAEAGKIGVWTKADSVIQFDDLSATSLDAPRAALATVADVDLPGAANRFDYQDIDATRGLLVIAHMNDASVVIADLKDGAVKKVLPNIATVRGVVAAPDIGKIFVTSKPDKVVVIDSTSLAETARVTTGNAPDGIGWDPTHKIVAVSDQKDGAVSLIPDSGKGKRVQVPLGTETGNVVFDAPRGVFWVTVVGKQPPDQLVAIDPVAAKTTTKIDLPGCKGAHGLRIHPDGKSALIACEENDLLVRVDLGGSHALTSAPTGAGPDVLAIDPGLGLLYVAAEKGPVTILDIGKPGLTTVAKQQVAEHAHTVAVDPATHRVFFPLESGPKGSPALRIMKPGGS